MTNIHLGELARCPFCGSGDLAMRTISGEKGTQNGTFVRCKECGGMGPPVASPTGSLIGDAVIRRAVQWWNKRTV